MIKKDEILLVKTILKHCKKRYDMLHRVSIDRLEMNYKRLLYILHKMCNNNLLNYGVNVYFGWIDKDPSEIIEYYRIRGVNLDDKCNK